MCWPSLNASTRYGTYNWWCLHGGDVTRYGVGGKVMDAMWWMWWACWWRYCGDNFLAGVLLGRDWDCVGHKFEAKGHSGQQIHTNSTCMQCIESMLSVCLMVHVQYMRKINNFHGVMEIYTALNMGCIQRLVHTWKVWIFAHNTTIGSHHSFYRQSHPNTLLFWRTSSILWKDHRTTKLIDNASKRLNLQCYLFKVD